MRSFAVASNFAQHREFFTGVAADVAAPSPELSVASLHSPNRARAWNVLDRAAAVRVVDALEVVASAAGEPRTWYVVELPEPPRVSVADAPRAARRAGAAVPPGARSAPSSAGATDA